MFPPSSTAGKGFFLILFLVQVFGCSGTRGLLYTNVVHPFSSNYDGSEVAQRHTLLDLHSVKEPISGRGITIRWTRFEIRAAARKAGIDTISYIDEQTLSVLGGIYKRRRLIIYGR